MLPLLMQLSDGEEYSMKHLIKKLYKHFNLSDAEINLLLPSGGRRVIDSRIGWARTYMYKAGLIDIPRRGYIKITNRGVDTLNKKLLKIDVAYLKQYDEFNKFLNTKKENSGNSSIAESMKTPEEAIEYGFQELNQNLAQELKEKLHTVSPSFFEMIVVELLVKMGYGGTLREAGQVIGKSGDEGIDGIIKEDRLGIDTIYIQAKRWGQSVGRPEIQKFVGALAGQKAKKGIFITTSYFTQEAVIYAQNIESKVILIDGEMLTELMIEHNLGVSVQKIYEIKKADNDYFIEE
jgi:restriction system protein